MIARDLVDAGLEEVEVLLEYRLPYTSRRADVVLAGWHPTLRTESYVVVELKQWSRARIHDEAEGLVHVEGSPRREHLHPSVQVAGYVDFIRDFTAALHDEPNRITGVAYLHNAHRTEVADLVDAPVAAASPVFTSSSRGQWIEFLQSRLAPSSGAVAADRLLKSAVRPSKQLLAVAADEVRRREQFTLLDDQKVAFELVRSAVARAARQNTKTAVVVSGGPGTGKSVVALSLLGELAREGRSVLHATGSQSFTKTLRRVAGKGSTATQRLFMYFNSFMAAEQNELDVLVLDEAHRIRDKSVNRFTPKAMRDRARPQIEELLDAARVPVFLLDEHQVVRPGESGTVESITTAAEKQGIRVEHVTLEDQFRAGGSELYIDWVLRLLGLVDGGPVAWQGDDRFELRTAASPRELEVGLERHLERGLGARMTAGYAWRWSDPLPDSTLVPDVVVGDWARPWNVKDERRVGDAPPSFLWATEEGGFGQVGCIYTAQGFEYDWNGVILGPDLVWRTDRWVALRDENKDPAFRSRKQVSDEDFDALVRNVYKVLLTRGMAGTIVHSVDPETQRLLERLVQPGGIHGGV
ncbi:DUF2075 domain-containing protein [Isoptericola sp. 178]|uniref:DUF2075 domain-containing protein n=1 Tax=Isoptericola sp. 178 TaxID=3064651 RepID=UPI0027131444|nr:DUF2075 domain-containing protein [Isoptericola sp. 178]MDO8143626.1 DUF2075 domain-containing protein [Isoptericola sp. 178]